MEKNKPLIARQFVQFIMRLSRLPPAPSREAQSVPAREHGVGSRQVSTALGLETSCVVSALQSTAGHVHPRTPRHHRKQPPLPAPCLERRICWINWKTLEEIPAAKEALRGGSNWCSPAKMGPTDPPAHSCCEAVPPPQRSLLPPLPAVRFHWVRSPIQQQPTPANRERVRQTVDWAQEGVGELHDRYKPFGGKEFNIEVA